MIFVLYCCISNCKIELSTVGGAMETIPERLTCWLLDGDVSIQYQVARDLQKKNAADLAQLQSRIATEGWGYRYLCRQREDGHWGLAFYQPKWTSTHYTLLDLKTLGLPSENEQARRGVEVVLEIPKGWNGGIRCSESSAVSDVCVNGMILNYASWFLPEHSRLAELVDFLLSVQMKDGGWNCRYHQKGTTHSSLHSTISVLEGLLEFSKRRPAYKSGDIKRATEEGAEFLLLHRLYKSHRTGATIDSRMLRLSFPCRWRYDILRALDYLRDAKVRYDTRMEDSLAVLEKKRRKDGTWPVQEKHRGEVHFDMEKTGGPSRWNTLRALRVLQHFRGASMSHRA